MLRKLSLLSGALVFFAGCGGDPMHDIYRGDMHHQATVREYEEPPRAMPEGTVPRQTPEAPAVNQAATADTAVHPRN